MIKERYFGSLRGREVYEIIMDNGVLSISVLSYGATLRSLVYKNTDVCLGYDRLGQYASCDGYIGACVGRHANRISGSKFTLNGCEYKISSNEGDNQLHGGIEGFSHKIWDYTIGENETVFTLDSPDGDEGFPGNMHVEICYRLNKNELIIEYRAKSDKDTVANFTNHAYFNLGGHDSGAVYGHELLVNACSYTPCGKGNIPTGDIAPVAGSALDFRCPTLLGPILVHPSLAETKGLDHNFVLNDTYAASLFCPSRNIKMSVYTSMEGLQVYSAGFLSPRPGKNGAVYGQHHAICLETQHFPDSINKHSFPSPVLHAGEEYYHHTSFIFE